MPYQGQFRGVDLSHLRPKPAPTIHYDSHADPWQPWMGQGWIDQVEIASPGAGVLTVTHTCPGDVWEMPLRVAFTLTADATVATRTPALRMLDATGSDRGHLSTANTVAANGQSFQAWMRNLNGVIAANDGWKLLPMPDFLMLPGYQLIIRNVSGQAGDTLTNISIGFMRWRNHPRRRSLLVPVRFPL